MWSGELNFLNELNSDRSVGYRYSFYLKTSFEANTWIFDFGKSGKLTIDFYVKLENGSLLTEKSNEKLLDTFKCWICIQTHSDVTRGIIYKDRTAYHATRRVIHLIDYFLLNSNYFKLSKHGLNNVTENDIVMMLGELASSSEISNSIYKWKSKLTEFLRTEICKLDKKLLFEVIENTPLLKENISDAEDRMLELTDEELLLSRAMLWKGNFYKSNYKNNMDNSTYRLAPNTELISEILYADTLRGKFGKPQPEELSLSSYQSFAKEFPRASVRNGGDDQMAEKEWGMYKSTIRSLGYLNEITAAVPIFSPETSIDLPSQYAFALKQSKRYQTIPPKIILHSFRIAIDFALNYGHDILESALAVIAANKNPDGKSFVSFDISPFITSKVKEMGVKVWSLKSHVQYIERNLFTGDMRLPSEDYFKRLRNNEGLYELLRIFFGAVEFCIGTLMARRQSELIELISGRCLNKSKTHLVFFNRKSGFSEFRVKESRPIPKVAVKLIELLENFHFRLGKINNSTEDVFLFSYPDLHSITPNQGLNKSYNYSLDILCDYIEVPLNERGERYYFRQHQLRRFFAMMFFWGSSFGGMDTLRWFLGHTDIEHLYHYITESTPGNVLRASKANYGSEVIKTDSLVYPELSDIIEKRFGTRNFKILDSVELTEFIEDLIADGSLEIEPIFFDCLEGKSYRIAIKIINKKST